MPKHSSNALIALLALLALVLLAVWLWPAAKHADKTTSTATAPVSSPVDPVVSPVPAVSGTITPAPREPAPILNGGKTAMQAYRFALHGGVISLEATDRIEGDFHHRRGPMAWMPGMWCVRVLDANQQALAQETTVAPDEPCVVLDPNVTTAAGQPQASRLKLTDDVMTQVRLPTTPGAKWVKIYRLAGTQPVGLDVEPLGQLLATLSIP